jgi:hypothetical protein
MTTFSNATVHSIVRSKERLGLNERRAEKTIQLAIERGKDYTEFNSSRERKYLEQHTDSEVYAVAYNGYCYIINNTGFCITVYELPEWFGKKKQYDGKTKIKNMKAYYRNYSDLEDMSWEVDNVNLKEEVLQYVGT